MPEIALFRKASYSASVASSSDPCPRSLAEIAFAGRSNAGKSSVINTLAGHRRLAFVSKKPGRTRMINFFALGDGRYLVDLPGYGFAAAPGTVRAGWDRLLARYLQHRAALRGLALIMDIRHPFTALDLQLMEFFGRTGKPIHVMLTKADKLPRSSADAALFTANELLARIAPHHSAQLFSSLKRQGSEEAQAVFSRWLGLPALITPRPAGKPRVHLATRGENKKPRAKGG